MKIQQVPIRDKPEKPHTCKSQKRIPDFAPKPSLFICPTSDAVINNRKRAQTSHQGDHLQHAQPPITPL